MALSIVYTSFSNLDEAKLLAEEAVFLGKAACVNIFPAMLSVYKWKGKVESAQEYAAIFKTSSELGVSLVEWIKSRHSYDTPAVILLSAETTAEFLEYVEESLQCRN